MVLKFLCWNVNGLNEKTQDKLFDKYLENNDFIFLVETWLNKPIQISNYYCYSKNRTKTKIHGRHSGGITAIIKKELHDGIKILENNSDIFVCIKLDKFFFSLNEDLYVFIVYLPPCGSNFYNYNDNKDPFEKLSSAIMDYSSKGQILLLGDLNARTKGLSDFFENKEIHFLNDQTDSNLQNCELKIRKTLDKSNNKFGHLLVSMCKELQLVIHNGRTIGDLYGQYTCYRPNGCSTVDYAISCSKLYKSVLSLKVLEPNHLSDHAAITISIENNVKNDVTKPCKGDYDYIKNKFIWKQNSKETFEKVLQCTIIKNKISQYLKYDTTNSEKGKDDVDFLCTSLSNIFNEAAKFSLKIKKFSRNKTNKKSKKWHSVNYDNLVKNINIIGKKIKQRPDPDLLKQYSQMKKQANKLKKQNNKSFRQQLLEKIIDLDKNNPKEFWNIVNNLKKGKTTNLSNPSEYAKHISTLFNLKGYKATIKDKVLLEKLETMFKQNNYIEMLDKKIELQEILDCIKKLKNGKSFGHDAIMNEMLKCSTKAMAPLINKLFNVILEHEYFPEYWSLGYITPIYKGGDICDMNNYRPITITSSLSKVFTQIMNNRLTNFIDTNSLLHNEQIGFRKHQCTSDHIFVLKTLIDSFKSQKKTLYTCFIDLSKAFDTVWREGLYYKLLKLGVSSKFVNVLKSLYSNINSKIKVKNLLSKSINIDIGTRQGCNLSPSLFNIYLNDLPKLLDHNKCDPVLLYDKYINILMYADDIVLMSSSKLGLQNCLNTFEQFCGKWKLKINHKKTKIILFNSRKSDNFFLNSKTLSHAESYCYLGIVFNRNGTFKTGIDNLTAKGKKSYFSWCSEFNNNNNTPISVILKLFDSLVKPILLYGSEIWGATCKNLINGNYKKYLLENKMKFEIFFSNVCKYILGVKKTASNIGSKAELGVYPLSLTIMQKIINYYTRVNQMEDTVLAKKALLHQNVMYLKECNNSTLVKRSFLHSVASAVTFSGCKSLELNQSGNKISHSSKLKLKNNLQQKYSELVFNSLYDNVKESKLRTYLQFKKNYRKELYLDMISSSKLRTAVTKLRISDHSLPIEIGRRNNIDLNNRFCEKCNTNKLGDEFHFILECENVELSKHRNDMLKNISVIMPQFETLNDYSKFLYIILCSDKCLIGYISKFIFNGLSCTKQL